MMLTHCIPYYSHYLEISESHTQWGEAFGVVCWLWIFHRARTDGPVVLGWRHPWDHDHDDHGHDDHHAAPTELPPTWDKFAEKAMNPSEDDDDDEEEEDDEE